MVVRIGIMVLRFCFLAALVLGILIWIGTIDDSSPLRSVHIVLGILTVLSLWLLGYMLSRVKGAGLGLTTAALLLGLVVAIWGITQQNILAEPNPAHWVVQIVHLLFGLSAIGLGEAIAGRYKRLTAAKAAQAVESRA